MREGMREPPVDSGSLAAIGSWFCQQQEGLIGFFWEIKKIKNGRK